MLIENEFMLIEKLNEFIENFFNMLIENEFTNLVKR